MCYFFDKRGYPAFVVQPGHHRAQQIIDQQSALQTSQRDNNDRIQFHPRISPSQSLFSKQCIPNK